VGEAERYDKKPATTIRNVNPKFSETALSKEAFLPVADCVYDKGGVTIYRVRK
jgi:hypothetical protein